MFLKNYTSDVPVSRTIQRIEDVLIRCGVKGITKEYDPSAKVCAMRFHMELPNQPEATVRLAPRIDEAEQALWLDYADGDETTSDGKIARNARKRRTRASFRQQAERTAWRLMQDRIEVEMSLIELKQRDVKEAFMADVWDGTETLYQRIQSRGFRALLPETSSAVH